MCEISKRCGQNGMTSRRCFLSVVRATSRRQRRAAPAGQPQRSTAGDALGMKGKWAKMRVNSKKEMGRSAQQRAGCVQRRRKERRRKKKPTAAGRKGRSKGTITITMHEESAKDVRNQIERRRRAPAHLFASAAGSKGETNRAPTSEAV